MLVKILEQAIRVNYKWENTNYQKIYEKIKKKKKINSEWIHDLIVSLKAVEFLEENVGKLHDFGLGNNFLNMRLKAQTTTTTK